MKKRLAVLFLTFCILFQTFGIQIGDYNAFVNGSAIIKKQAQSAAQTNPKSYFLALEENETNCNDDTDSNDFYYQQTYNLFSFAYLLLNSTFYPKNNRDFLLFNSFLKVHKFLIFRNLRI